ncbi:hypothetical protein Paes_0977 [Prosthecochloris aestuarii DSM 271]|uniref:Uncharacterized protein n=1 Tax=Prosthecochloris aestuarii (strain DSM 271 / SK 413) TaxID=290512 RepID=B4S7I1_PROA2|nr:hypothetical protein [Prosthecochloris aestuarii]ACF46018.1 hypothetical protein Paes_0977 [Prosthecochloris aestuarii DSM 271]
MPYFINCVRCNKKNDYLTVDQECGKCGGTGRDWREDHELKGDSDWPGFSLLDLKQKKKIEVKRFSDTLVFTYRDRILSLKEDKTEVSEIYGIDLSGKKTAPSIFVEESDSGSTFSNAFFGAQDVYAKKSIEKKEYRYDKSLHDGNRYYPNRCEGCVEYENTQGDVQSGSDYVLCNIAGKVRADTGCAKFEPDITAACDDCWNYRKTKEGFKDIHYCFIHGDLQTAVSGYCNEYVCKAEFYEVFLGKNTSDNSYLNMLDELESSDDDELFGGIDDVKRKQREYGVYAGDRRQNCERCSNAIRDSESPTGLKCGVLSIYVTANAACDQFDR